MPPDDDNMVSESVNFEDKPAGAPVTESPQPEPSENALAEAPNPEPSPENELAPVEDADETSDASETSEAKPEGSEKPKHAGNSWQKRVNKLTKERSDLQARADALQAERDLYKRMAEGTEGKPAPEQGTPDAPPAGAPKATLPQYGTQEYQAAVQAEAARIAEQKTFEQRFSDWEGTGIKDYPDFRDRCATLASLGATENPAFVPALLDIDNGAKVAAKLAEDPDEATRILSLSPTRMISELTKMGLEIGKPKAKAISKAPAPIKPVDGSAQLTDEVMPDDSEESMYRKWEAADRKKRMQRYGQL